MFFWTWKFFQQMGQLWKFVKIIHETYNHKNDRKIVQREKYNRKGIVWIIIKHFLCLPFSASVSTGVGPPEMVSVKNVPTLRPAIIVLIALSWVPLQMTTLTPRSNAHVAAFTFESIPPVPTYFKNLKIIRELLFHSFIFGTIILFWRLACTLDFLPNSIELRSCDVYVCINRAPSSHGGLL